MTLRNGIPWPQLTFVLAKDIIDKNIHTTYLTPAEVHCFETATETLPQWIAFFTSSPNHSDDNSTMDLDVHENPNQQHQNNYNNVLLLTELETSAFRVRSLLFEKFIPHLYHSDRPCCQLANLDIEAWTDKAYALPTPDPLQVKEAIDDLQQKRQQQLKQQQELQSRQAQQPCHDTPSNDQLSSNQQKEPPPPQQQEQQEQQQQPPQQQSDSSVQENGMDESTTTDKQAPSVLSLADPDKIPLLDIYHTLETDQPVMIEQQKLKEYEAQEALNEEEEEKENAQDHSLSMFNADGNFTLKYLLKGISANWETMGLSDRELQNLLSDFKPHRSKWANDEKQGQEELYEAMEKVLLELKNYTAHSTPFLNKVSKREAPDYLDVIVRPMDLGTVAKKLKQLEYKTKQEFADDLYLIYDNCLIYNTNPASEYRKHATAMRRKTERLLTRVPNLVIKDKSDGEQEEEGEEASDEDQDEKHHHAGKTPGKHKHAMTSVQKNDASVVDVDRASRERSLTRGSSAAPGTSTESLAGDNDTEGTPDVYDAHKTYGGKQLKSQNGIGVFDSGQEKDLNGDIDAEWGELREQVWYEVTKKTRAERTKDMLEQDLEPFGEHEALVRSAFEMERFAMMENTHNNTKLARKLVRCTEKNLVQWTDRRRPGDASIYDDDVDLDSSDDEILDAFFSRKISKPKHADEDDAARANLFLPDYAITAGIPDIANIPQEYKDPTNRRLLSRKGSTDSNTDLVLDSKGYTDVSLEAYADAIFPNHGLNNMIDNNIQKLQQIRRIHAKCTAVRNNVSMSSLRSSILPETVDTTQPPQLSTSMEDMISPLAHPSTLPAVPASALSTTPSISAQSIPDTSRRPPPLLITDSSAQDIFQRMTSKLLAHAGFEGANENALRVLTDVATDYITNIGKTLRCYVDDYGKQMTGEEILMHTLYENGVVELFDLENYIHDDVERYGYRLDDVHRRLQTSYQDLLSGPSGPTVRDEESLLQDDDTFITGVFGEDLGEDYFGFKDLGLDQEYNMNTLSIPSRLWHGRNDTKAQATALTSEEPLFKYQPRPPFTPLTSSKQVIGLLQPYFDKKFSETEENRLVEDEFSQTRSNRRPRHPPVHLGLCAPGGGRKKLGKDGYGTGSGDKKGKRKRPTEEIKAEKAERAEKRRLKMEEKKQKVAEKEQKRKLREEIKEQERLAKQEAKEKKAQAKKSTASSVASKQQSSLGSNSSSPSVYEKEDH